MLFSSHLLDEVQQVSDHVALIVSGKLVVSEPIDDYLRRHSCWTLRLQQPLEQMPEIPGVVNCSGEGLEWKFLCVGDVTDLEAWVSNSGAQVVTKSTPALDEIFVDFLRPTNCGFTAIPSVQEQ